ncbi:MAG: hypothetical protein K9W43_07140 [Candidatus Thorarchaeota archaeon]|nr:hypothetical protein [Candidatus Thorarchaeota archaeon]
MQSVWIILAGSTHVFTAVLVMIFAVLMFGESMWGGSAKRFKMYSIGLIVFSALTYVIAGWWYVVYYGADKAIITAGEVAWAHTLIMETKEHIFISGFWFAIALGIIGYFVTDEQLNDPNFRKTIALLSAMLVIGVMLIEGMGGIIIAGLKIGFGGA